MARLLFNTERQTQDIVRALHVAKEGSAITISRSFKLLPQTHKRILGVLTALQSLGNWKVKIAAPNRTLEQNDKMWAMLTPIAKEMELKGSYYSTADWKCYFLHILGSEQRFMPSHNNAYIPVGSSSKALTKSEFSDLFEVIRHFAAVNNIDLKEPAHPQHRQTA
ncbi:MAG: hypothetical protein COA43_01180 [Robiginitomaculum sp.]|nr:MAG: hypothetical protein COA43_01180 [Robiginitomaculum sp.]